MVRPCYSEHLPQAGRVDNVSEPAAPTGGSDAHDSLRKVHRQGRGR
jgi:hypothetical protein